jgi:hypothetical protein
VGRQIVDHHAQIRLGAPERRQRPPTGLARRVDACSDPLCAGFFIAGRAVDLSGQE